MWLVNHGLFWGSEDFQTYFSFYPISFPPPNTAKYCEIKHLSHMAQLFIPSHRLTTLLIYSKIHRKANRSKCWASSVCLGFHKMTTNLLLTSQLFDHVNNCTNINGMSTCLTVESEMSSQKCPVCNCFRTETLVSVSP